MDSHAPVKEKLVSIRPKKSWSNHEIVEARRQKRKAERKWRKTGLEIDRDIFRQVRNQLSFKISNAKANFYRNKVEECKGDQKKLFQMIQELMHQKQVPTLPSYISAEKLAESFSDFFIHKIKKIREEISNQDCCHVSTDSTITSQHELSDLPSATEEEIKNIVLAAKNSTCELDPLPTSLLKELCRSSPLLYHKNHELIFNNWNRSHSS